MLLDPSNSAHTVRVVSSRLLEVKRSWLNFSRSSKMPHLLGKKCFFLRSSILKYKSMVKILSMACAVIYLFLFLSHGLYFLIRPLQLIFFVPKSAPVNKDYLVKQLNFFIPFIDSGYIFWNILK